MSNLIPGNQKHLTLEDRLYIEHNLDEGKSFKDIAKYICKDPTTISKEIRKHRVENKHNIGSFISPHNSCVKRFNCKLRNVCEKITICDRKCASCIKCNHVCKQFIKERCHRIEKAPYVCNGCDKPRHRCSISIKYDYNAKYAHRIYRETLSESREGINMSRSELHQLDMTVTPLIMQGQSPYQVQNNHSELNRSVRTLYQYLDDGILTARNIDLKRKVKFKPRKTRRTYITDRSVFKNRTYDDFVAHKCKRVVEMDTVLSARESKKTILTFFLKEEKLFLAFLINRCTKGEVIQVFDRLEKRLGTYDFLTIFETILTDRGSEFADPGRLETGCFGIERTSIYYCDPMRSSQKGAVENTHNILRTILPKGVSFEYLTQWDINLIVNHINSMPRASLNGQTPYQLALKRYGIEILNNLQLKPISPDEVNLTPKLIK